MSYKSNLSQCAIHYKHVWIFYPEGENNQTYELWGVVVKEDTAQPQANSILFTLFFFICVGRGGVNYIFVSGISILHKQYIYKIKETMKC